MHVCTYVCMHYFKMNLDKCHLLITNHEEDASATIEGEIIKCKKSIKLLGINIDNKLRFNEHISKICKRVSLKLYTLSRISHFLSTEKLRTVMKAFIESQFEYCPSYGCSIGEHWITKLTSWMKELYD